MINTKDNPIPLVSLNFLRTHSLFGGITDYELEKIRKLLIEKHFPAETDIVREGEPGGDLYLIWKGSVEVLKKNPDDPNAPPMQLTVLNEGDSFGEMELIDIQCSGASVKTREETITLILTNGDLYSIEGSNLQTFTMIIMNLAREISRRLRTIEADAARANFKRT
jgi:CRP/FNR family transcriptional regulator, cyclic AMP receptor protein